MRIFYLIIFFISITILTSDTGESDIIYVDGSILHSVKKISTENPVTDFMLEDGIEEFNSILRFITTGEIRNLYLPRK